jgi:UDP-glucuronate 4-epimerase
MNILVTGSAGFIGSHLVLRLLASGHKIYGLDNQNDYYDQKLKQDRLNLFLNNQDYKHFKVDLTDKIELSKIFREGHFDVVVNLAAQAGVRFSIEKPDLYVQSNVSGFLNLLELSKSANIKHFVYASSSSVYGANASVPYSVHQNVNHPLNIYAATKKTNELFAHTYSSLFNLPTTGVRFFTVYGPWGRPDMAPFIFTKNILEDKPIKIFNYGNHSRDFTYIDDIVSGLIRIINKSPEPNSEWSALSPDPASSFAPYRIYNIGNSKPVNILKFIEAIEISTGKKAIKEMMPMQPGEIETTWADVSDLERDIGYRPQTSYLDGVKSFVEWYRNYYN